MGVHLVLDHPLSLMVRHFRIFHQRPCDSTKISIFHWSGMGTKFYSKQFKQFQDISGSPGPYCNSHRLAFHMIYGYIFGNDLLILSDDETLQNKLPKGSGFYKNSIFMGPVWNPTLLGQWKLQCHERYSILQNMKMHCTALKLSVLKMCINLVHVNLVILLKAHSTILGIWTMLITSLIIFQFSKLKKALGAENGYYKSIWCILIQ